MTDRASVHIYGEISVCSPCLTQYTAGFFLSIYTAALIHTYNTGYIVRICLFYHNVMLMVQNITALSYMGSVINR